MWDRLLTAIYIQQNRFLAAFVKLLLAIICDPSTGQSKDDAEKEALCMWLVHTTSKKKSWAPLSSAESDALRKEMVMWSCTHPGYWSYYLGVHLIKAGGPDFANIWEDVLEASRLGDGHVGVAVIGGADFREASSPEPETTTRAEYRSRSGYSGGHRGGWRRAAGAPAMPIGIVR